MTTSGTSRKGILAALFLAAITLVPAPALASTSLNSTYIPMTAEEQDRFVAEWSEAFLSQDLAIVESMPDPTAYSLWTAEFRRDAVERLYHALDAGRPDDVPAMTDLDEIARVKMFISLYIFSRDEIANPTPPADLVQDLESVEMGDPLGDAAEDVNAEILARADPQIAALLAIREFTTPTAPTTRLSLRDLVDAGDLGKVIDPLTPPDAPETPTLPEDEVNAALAPYVENAQNLVPIGGTYTLRVRSGDTDTIIQDVPFGVVLPLDIDEDGRTGLGGIDITAGVILDAAPGTNVNLDMAPDFTGTVSDLAPALVIKRVAHAEAPDFEPVDSALVEAYVSLNGGTSFGYVGVDGREERLPDEVVVAFFTQVDLTSTTGTDLLDVMQATVPVLESDGRALADAVAAKTGQPLPWYEIDHAPEIAQAAAEDALAQADALIQAQLAEAVRTIEPVTTPVGDAVAQAEREAQAVAAQVDGAVQPVLADAQAAIAQAERDAQAVQAELDATLQPILADAQRAAEEQITETGAVVSDTMTQVDEAVAPLRTLGEETRDAIDAQLADVANQVNAQLADAQRQVDEATKEPRDQVEAARADLEAQAQQVQADANREVEKVLADVDAQLDVVNAYIGEFRAYTYARAVDANKAAGEQKNVLVHTSKGIVPAAEQALVDAGVPAPTMTVAPLVTPPDAELPPEAQPVVAEAAPVADAAGVLASDAQAGGEAAAGTVHATKVRPGADFKLQVRTLAPQGDIVVTGGLVHLGESGAYEQAVTAILRIQDPPAALNLSYVKTDGVTVRLESTEPSTLTGFFIRDDVNGGADVVGFAAGELPKWIALSFVGKSYSYSAADTLDFLGVERIGFRTHSDFEAWLSGSALTGKVLSVLATGIPSEFAASIEGGAAAWEASSRMTAVQYTAAKFRNGYLDGDFVRFLLGGIPTKFSLNAERGGKSFAFEADGPIGIIDAERTNGPRLSRAPAPGFAVLYDRAGGELAHLRLLNLQSVVAATGPGGNVFDARLTGGYSFLVSATKDAMTVQGLVLEMPSHIRAVLLPSAGFDATLIMEPASSRGIVAAASAPQFGGKTVALSITNLPSYMHMVVDSRVPSFRYDANGVINGIFAGMYLPSGQLAASIGFYGIPTSFYFGLTKFGSGLPNVIYQASASTLDVELFVDGNALGVFPGHAFLQLINVPRLGLSFGADGGGFQVRANGDRLTQFYMDVGYRFGGSFAWDRTFVDSWWLLARAYVYFNYDVNIKHFRVLMQNLRSLDLTPSVPLLRVSVDGVFQTAFDIHLGASLAARAYAYLLRVIPVLDIGLWFSWSGPFPIAFTTWSYQWFAWSFVLLAVPIICAEWWSWGWRPKWHVSWGTYQFVVEVGLRLPTGFYTTWNGFGVAYGTASVFVNPGGIIPFWAIYTYALLGGFDAYARSYWRSSC